MTGTFGGLVRDVCCRRPPLILTREVYAAAAFAGGAAYCASRALLAHSRAAILVGFVAARACFAAANEGCACPKRARCSKGGFCFSQAFPFLCLDVAHDSQNDFLRGHAASCFQRALACDSWILKRGDICHPACTKSLYSLARHCRVGCIGLTRFVLEVGWCVPPCVRTSGVACVGRCLEVESAHLERRSVTRIALCKCCKGWSIWKYICQSASLEETLWQCL